MTLLIDLENDFFIVKLSSREEFVRAMSEGPWMVGDNYLHVQRWRHNFNAEAARIYSLPVWVRFPTLPVEYYSEAWLRYVGNQIGKTIKVDNTTLATARGRFARVCVEIDLVKPLLASYRLRGIDYHIQYEGLQDICFSCGKFGHRAIHCTPCAKTDEHHGQSEENKEANGTTATEPSKEGVEGGKSGLGPWMVAQRTRRRPAKNMKGNSVNGSSTAESGEIRADPKSKADVTAKKGVYFETMSCFGRGAF